METTFQSLGVARDIAEQLARIGIVSPTPIQAQAIPEALTGRDVIGIAQTGTGKTLAFGIPIISRLSRARTQALVLVPTRELADQVEASLHSVGQRFGLRTALLIGGAAMGKQVLQLRRRPHVIVATPGRLLDHLEQQTLTLREVSILVLDEADRMLDMGFAPQVNKILAAVPTERQTMLFSATMPQAITDLSHKTLKQPLTVSVAPAGTTADRIDQSLTIVDKGAKTAYLQQLLAGTTGSTLVFTRTKYGAKKLCRSLNQAGILAAEIHGNRSLPQRREALAGFKSGRYRVLVATDIAARGIDVVGIDLVVNYDLPEQTEDYVHRIGRTGRAGLSGKAISFAEPDQGNDVRAIERLIGQPIPRERSGSVGEFSTASPSHSQPRGHGHQRQRNRLYQPRHPQSQRTPSPRPNQYGQPTYRRPDPRRDHREQIRQGLTHAPVTHKSWAHTMAPTDPLAAPTRTDEVTPAAQPIRPTPVDPATPFII